MASLRYAAASSAVKRRSAARTSRSSPRARKPASGHGGSARLATTRCSCAGRCSTRNSIDSCTSDRLDDVVVVEHQDDIAVEAGDVVEQGGDDVLQRARRRLQ